MHVVDLIAVEDGHWAAHCETLAAGSLSRSRARALARVQAMIADAERAPQHPEYREDGDKIYPLPRPGHYSF